MSVRLKREDKTDQFVARHYQHDTQERLGLTIRRRRGRMKDKIKLCLIALYGAAYGLAILILTISLDVA